MEHAEAETIASEQQAILIQRLREAGFDSRRFITVGPDKKNHDPGWDERPLNPPEELIERGWKRWGVVGRDGLVLIDADKPEMDNILRKILPPTFEVTSPRRGLPHRYYVVVGGRVENKILHLPGDTRDDDKAGEIRAQNMYLVAPGTERARMRISGPEATITTSTRARANEHLMSQLGLCTLEAFGVLNGGRF
jgi:hypothetical protein